jgi:hypothetical protein
LSVKSHAIEPLEIVGGIMRIKPASQAAHSNDRKVFGSFLQETLRFGLAIHFAGTSE